MTRLATVISPSGEIAEVRANKAAHLVAAGWRYADPVERHGSAPQAPVEAPPGAPAPAPVAATEQPETLASRLRRGVVSADEPMNG
jgi:hypothetical protein